MTEPLVDPNDRFCTLEVNRARLSRSVQQAVAQIGGTYPADDILYQLTHIADLTYVGESTAGAHTHLLLLERHQENSPGT